MSYQLVLTKGDEVKEKDAPARVAGVEAALGAPSGGLSRCDPHLLAYRRGAAGAARRHRGLLAERR